MLDGLQAVDCSTMPASCPFLPNFLPICQVYRPDPSWFTRPDLPTAWPELNFLDKTRTPRGGEWREERSDAWLESRARRDLISPRRAAMSEVVAMAGQAYMRQLGKHPLRTKAITSGVLAGCSDAVAQKISGVKKLQFRRLLLIMVSISSLLLPRFSCLLALILPIHARALSFLIQSPPTPQSRRFL